MAEPWLLEENLEAQVWHSNGSGQETLPVGLHSGAE